MKTNYIKVNEDLTITQLNADEDKILTNGETYGRQIYLGIHDSPYNWHEISAEEYEAILAAQVPEDPFM